jgi:hypothetical protein
MVPSLKKPDLAEVYGFLRKHNALIVHFSGAPKGAGLERGWLFPKDLANVLAGGAMGGLSCSVVRVGDVFQAEVRNATGCIGVVLGFQSKDSLVAVDPSDCGSMEDDETGIREVPHERDIAVADLERTLTERTDYNEWVVRDYVPIGILAVPPLEVDTLSVPMYPPDVPQIARDETPAPCIVRIDPVKMTNMFMGQNMYTFKKGKILCRRNGLFYPVDHSEIYPDLPTPESSIHDPGKPI